MSDPPVIIPIRDLLGGQIDGVDFEAQLRGLVGKYRRTLQPDRRVLLEQFEFTDMARKVVGVGSVGTRCWIILMLGRDDDDPLFLQVKEAQESVLCAYAGTSKYGNQGERVVNGQRLMQAASDIFLGWQRATGIDGVNRDFYVRQLRDWKFSIDIASMIPRGLRLYGELCGFTLARAHARSATRSPSPHTSAAPTCSTRPSPTSPPLTRTRTSRTTRRSPRPSPRTGCTPNAASDQGCCTSARSSRRRRPPV